MDKSHTRNVGDKTHNKDKRKTKEITQKYKTKIMSKTYSTKKKKQGEHRWSWSLNSSCISKDNGHVTQSSLVTFSEVMEEENFNSWMCHVVILNKWSNCPVCLNAIDMFFLFSSLL